jgi:hypothetical protein
MRIEEKVRGAEDEMAAAAEIEGQLFPRVGKIFDMLGCGAYQSPDMAQSPMDVTKMKHMLAAIEPAMLALFKRAVPEMPSIQPRPQPTMAAPPAVEPDYERMVALGDSDSALESMRRFVQRACATHLHTSSCETDTNVRTVFPREAMGTLEADNASTAKPRSPGFVTPCAWAVHIACTL